MIGQITIRRTTATLGPLLLLLVASSTAIGQTDSWSASPNGTTVIEVASPTRLTESAPEPFSTTLSGQFDPNVGCQAAHCLGSGRVLHRSHRGGLLPGGYDSGCHCRHGLRGPTPFHNLWLHDQDYFQSWPEPAYSGAYVDNILEAQVAAGRLAQLVFRHSHFDHDDEGDVQLSTFGWRHVNELKRLWLATPGPIRVQPTGMAELDLARLHVAHRALAEAGLPIDLIELALTELDTAGLGGVEATQIYWQRIIGRPAAPITGSATGGRVTGGLRGGDGSGLGTSGGGGMAPR